MNTTNSNIPEGQTRVRTEKREYYINQVARGVEAFYLYYRVINAKTGLPWQGIKSLSGIAGQNCHFIQHADWTYEVRDGLKDPHAPWPAGTKRYEDAYRTVEDARKVCV